MADLQSVFDATLADVKRGIDEMVGDLMSASLRVGLDVCSVIFTNSSRRQRPAAHSHASFLSERAGQANPANAHGFDVKVVLLPVPPPDVAVKGAIDKIEGAREASERNMFHQARCRSVADASLKQLFSRGQRRDEGDDGFRAERVRPRHR